MYNETVNRTVFFDSGGCSLSQALHIKGAQIWDGYESQVRDLFVKNGRIVAEKPNHALEIDLEGYSIFPGLINAHDHLELNHYPRTKFREVYDNAHQWGEDVNARLNEEPFKTLRSYPLWDRVFIGGLKNLLCGATTVIHHGPPHKPMFRKDFPVRVLKKYGWAHSLHFNTEEEIIRSYKETPKNVPWFIHLAEGTDEIAAGEYQGLKKMGCVGENTVIVHGVGMTEEDIEDAAKIVQSWVVCPSTNMYLLNVEVNNKIQIWIENGRHIAIGNDSRLTSDGDLLEEIVVAGYSLPLDEPHHHCERYASQMIESNLGWSLNSGNFADFYLSQPNLFKRNDTPLVVLDGIPQIGDAEMMAKFPHIQTIACTLDGVEKRMNIDLAKQVHRCQLKEKGLDVDDLPTGKRFIFF